MKKGKISIGTSGWSYKHWIGPFYPEDMSPSDEFHFYKKVFKTVEINSSFYHLPKAETFKNWRKNSPARFIFAVKASRYITHNKKLKTDDNSLEHFFEVTNCLKEKLGPVLFQLPPSWKLNLERLEEFLNALPQNQRCVLEFRNHSWFDEAVYQLLREHNCAMAFYELDKFQSPEVLTSDFVYLRFHGPGGKYQGSYTKTALTNWAKKIKHWSSRGLDVYVYFDNDQNAFAVQNARTLEKIVKIRPSPGTKTPKNSSSARAQI